MMVLLLIGLLVNAPAFTFGLSSDVLSAQVFIMPLTHHNFSLPVPGVNFRPSLLNMPDLPSWLHYTYSAAVHTGFVYGIPPQDIDDMKLEVIATDKHTYKTSRQVFDLSIHDQSPKLHEVRFKITNMNVDELLVSTRWERLRRVFIEDLWSKSEGDLAVTYLASATQHGDRLPAHPQDREGVYIGYGSNTPFSKALLELEREVEPLWDHQPCPIYFKKTSYERFFRQKNFAVDWCSFRLYDNNPSFAKPTKGHGAIEERPAILDALEKEGPVVLQKRSEVITRSYTLDVVHTILVPLVVMVALLGLLTLAMCCHSSNMDKQSSAFFDELFDDFPRMPRPQDIQMVHYASVNRASEALRVLRGREHSPHLSMATTTTQVETLPRSHTASPASTLQRTSTPRRFEDYATLSRPDPPPYQRNGSASAQ